MATRSDCSNNTAFTSCLIDLSFDLDEALTMPTNFGHQISDSKSLIERMPTVDSSSDDVCSVCMDGFGSDSVGKMIPCGHVFHASCISSWLSNYNSCPLCRFNISAAAGGSANS